MASARRRWVQIAVVALPVALFIAQCTPVIGCAGDRTYGEGRHLGFDVGMDRRAAADVVAASYRIAEVSVWTGTMDIIFIDRSDELMKVAAPFQQWRFRNHGRPHCLSPRNVVLIFRDERLASIKDEWSITLP